MNRSIQRITLALIFALTVSGCAPQYGEGWLSDANQATHDSYGAWVRVTLRFNIPANQRYEGELLAASKDSLYMIDVSQHSFKVFARQDIDEIAGNTYDRGGYWQYGAEAFIGSILSIFTTGGFFALLAPAYIISAIIGGSVASYISHISYGGDSADWHELSTYARFPTGLPPTYNRANPKTKLAASN